MTWETSYSHHSPWPRKELDHCSKVWLDLYISDMEDLPDLLQLRVHRLSWYCIDLPPDLHLLHTANEVMLTRSPHFHVRPSAVFHSKVMF